MLCYLSVWSIIFFYDLIANARIICIYAHFIFYSIPLKNYIYIYTLYLFVEKTNKGAVMVIIMMVW